MVIVIMIVHHVRNSLKRVAHLHEKKLKKHEKQKKWIASVLHVVASAVAKVAMQMNIFVVLSAKLLPFGGYIARYV